MPTKKQLQSLRSRNYPTPARTPNRPNNSLVRARTIIRNSGNVARYAAGAYRGYQMGGPLGAAAAVAGMGARSVTGRLMKSAIRRLFGKKKGSSYSTQGRYVGKFKKAKKFVDTGYNYFSNRGVVNTQETAGTVSDPDCVYISAQALDGIRVIQTATRALCRKLFQKAGFVISNAEELLISTGLTTATDWKVELTQVNGKTGVETVVISHTTGAASTLNSVANAFQGLRKR